ncbi:MAG: cobalt transporter CbiM [Thermoguttaceae bacterium]|nr:cobalt transporter CbiM [Thermoguttaceae bacterium]MDW8036632.1 cobalt transporter CbiM [Thermoguttaceae bacterium]
MHLSEAILAASASGQVVLAGGMLLAAGGVAVGLRQLEAADMPRTAILTSAFFVASLIHVPVMGTPVHLVLNGLLGLVLGWAAVPAVLVALLLQAVLFGFGGLLAVGVNTVVMALPAVLCYYLFRRASLGSNALLAWWAGAAAGFTGVMVAAFLAAGVLLATGKAFNHVAHLVLLANLPAAGIDAIVTAAAVSFLRKVRPEVFRR